jgi:hypothetical protein
MSCIYGAAANASKWQMGFNSAFKGLILLLHLPRFMKVAAILRFLILDLCGAIWFSELSTLKRGRYTLSEVPNTNDNKRFKETRSPKTLYMGYDVAVQEGEILRVTVRDVCWFPLYTNVDRSWKYQCSYLNYIFVLETSVCYRYCVLRMCFFPLSVYNSILKTHLLVPACLQLHFLNTVFHKHSVTVRNTTSCEHRTPQSFLRLQLVSSWVRHVWFMCDFYMYLGQLSFPIVSA